MLNELPTNASPQYDTAELKRIKSPDILTFYNL